jgi:hypothetical protein
LAISLIYYPPMNVFEEPCPTASPQAMLSPILIAGNPSINVFEDPPTYALADGWG